MKGCDNNCMNINEFSLELSKRLKELGIKVNKDDMKLIINTFVELLKEKVFEGFEVKIKNFGNIYLGKSDSRKLPNGDTYEQKDIIKIKLSRNFKNNS